jgi:quinoprotein dehydrogenase-associated probable ABC transporter substrate-binding protein
MRALFACASLLACACSSGHKQQAFNEPAHRLLRVCADPNNLPYSNSARQGFENKLADLVAQKLRADLQYHWQPQRRGFIRNTLKANFCDLIMGVPSESEMLLATIPYYRSTYVFVAKKESALHVTSLNSPLLRKLRIGVQIVGDDYTNTPPVHALSQRGIVRNVVGYRVTDDYAKASPTARLIEAVSAGDVDLAIAWGPIAGYFSQRQAVPLELLAVPPASDPHALPFVFDISMGIRRGEDNLKEELDAIIEENSGRISEILRNYGVPLVSSATASR